MSGDARGWPGRPRSLRARLTLTVLALLVGGLFAVPLATWAVIRDVGSDRARQQLARFAGDVTPLLAGGRTLGAGSGRGDAETLLRASAGAGAPSFLRLFAADGRVAQTVALDGDPGLGGPAKAWWPASRTAENPDGARFTRYDAQPDRGGPFRREPDWWLRGSRLPDGRVLVVGMRTTEYDEFVGRLTGVQVAITLLALGTLAVIAYRAIRRALRPLDRIAATARAIGEGDLTRRVEPADRRSEAGRLGLALNAMLGQIEGAFRERADSEERLRRFIADASHELRTPVATIRGYAELFRRGAAGRPEDLAKTLDRIESEAYRMGVLVDELLLLARLDQGRPLESRPVDLVGVAVESVGAARAVEPDRPLSMDATAGPLPVRGDAVRLRQALDNLLANVRQHTPPGTAARVTLRAEDRAAVVEVADDGPGLPAEHASHVFERFYRAGPARSRDHGGAGLGLAIVAAVADTHGGHASARPGPGAVFEIRLPLAGEDRSVTAAEGRDTGR